MEKISVIKEMQGEKFIFDILKCPRCKHEWEAFVWADCPKCGNKVVCYKMKE